MRCAGRAGVSHDFFDCVDDVRISGATTEVADQRVADLGFVGLRFVLMNSAIFIRIPELQKPHCRA